MGHIGKALLGISLGALAGVAIAQTTDLRSDGAPFGEQGRTAASVAKLPDWSGAWGLDQPSFMRGVDTATGSKTDSPNRAPLTAKYEAYRQSNGAANGGHGPETGTINNSARCIPNGMPDVMQAPYAFEFLFTPGRVTIIPENNAVRRIFTDGRPHPANVDPSFNGHSIGHWEGSTLVVDTVGMLPQAEIFMGLRGTGNQHVVERIFRKDKTTMEIDTTVYDSAMFTHPFSYVKTYKLSDHGMLEYACEQNNRDNNDHLDLTPPPE